MNTKKSLFMLLASVMLVVMAGLMTSCVVEDNASNSDVENLAEKIIGKWVTVEKDGQPITTNERVVTTFVSTTKAYESASLNYNPNVESLWAAQEEMDVKIDGRKVIRTSQINEHRTLEIELTVINISDKELTARRKVTATDDGSVIFHSANNVRLVKVNADYKEAALGLWECTELTGGETYNDANARLEFLADGTYKYWRKNYVGRWVEVTTREFQNYFVDGTLLATRWKNAGEDELREWWEIASIADDQMHWTALRKNADGTTSEQKLTWKKVQGPDDFDQIASLSTPLTLEAIEDGTITFRNNAANPVTYQINGGAEQAIPYVGKNSGGTEIKVSAGDVVTFKANNTTYCGEYRSKISCSADCYIYGNVMSLINAENFPMLKEFDTTNGELAFRKLFYGNTHIKNDGKNAIFLPATTLTPSCYLGMFCECTSLTEAPKLPATTLAERCYESMFEGCSSLTAAPELPATTLPDNCYSNMFKSCTSLTVAPELPATTLARDCYLSMFANCTSMTATPELPATTLADYCYSYMFWNCTSLTKAPVLPATTLVQGCYEKMFAGCTSMTATPELPATTLADYCYSQMFWRTSLTKAPKLPVTTLAKGCYRSMFYDCTSLTEVPELPATTLEEYCYYNMFAGCTSLTAAPVLPATTLVKGCYMYMFQDCSKLASVSCSATNISAETCTKDWLKNVAATGTFTTPSTTAWTSGVDGIPEGWTRVDK